METFSAETLTILGTILAAAFFLARQNTLMRSELRGDIDRLSDRMGAVENKMSHLDGLMEGLREAIAGRNVA